MVQALLAQLCVAWSKFKQIGIFSVLAILLLASPSAFAATCNVSANTTIDATYVTDNSCTLINLTGTPTITWSGTINSDVTVASGTTTFSGALVLGATNDFTISNGATITHAAGNTTGISISADVVTVSSGSTIDANGKGCQGGTQGSTSGYGPNTSTGICAQSTSGYGVSRAGGAYGGRGGKGSDSLLVGTTYGSSSAPTFLGSGGGAESTGYPSAGGVGGGKIRLDATTLTVSGTVSANGANGYLGAAGGSGGSVYITATTLAGAGTIGASGGNGAANSDHQGGGGGGRVAVYYDTLSGFTLGNITASKGLKTGGTAADGENGTTFILNRKTDDGIGDLYITSGLAFQDGIDFMRTNITAVSGSVLSCGSSGTVDVGATSTLAINGGTWTCAVDAVNITAGTMTTSGTNVMTFNKAGEVVTWNITNDFTLNNLTYTGGTAGTTRSNGGLFTVSTGNVTLVNSTINSSVNWTGFTSVNLDANSKISADGKGCQGGVFGSGNGYGPNLTTGICAQSTSGYGAAYNGGAHGGRGGNGSGSLVGTTYDSSSAPTFLGSGGGAESTGYPSAGGVGGGTIRLDAVTLTVDGTVSANGANGYLGAAGGSGGSVYITATTLAGAGTIGVSGGNGVANSGHQGGGGGGRAAVYLASGNFNLGNITATKGLKSGGSAADGEDGSVYSFQYTIPSTPSITSPAASSYNVSQSSATVSGSAYSSNGAAHVSSDWMIKTDNDCSNTTNRVWYKDTDAANKTSIVVNAANGTFTGALSGQTALASGTTYYACVRYNNGAGASNWSTASVFTTVNDSASSVLNLTFGNSAQYSNNTTYTTVDGGSDSLGKLKDLGGGTYAASAPDSLSAWTRRKPITVTEASGGTLTNYQVKVVVAYDSDMQADFDDIRFTDASGTSLDYWLESKTDSTTATFWVEVNSLTASSANTIYMYYGNGVAVTTSSLANTFIREISGATASLPLNEGAGTALTDQSGSSHGASLQSGPVWNSSANCRQSGCVFLDGTDDFIDVGTWLNYQTFTISLWVKPDPSQQAYADIFDNNHSSVNFVMQQNNTTINQYGFHNTGTFNLTANVWQHIVAVKDTTGAWVYVNGLLVASGPAASLTITSPYLRFGKWGGGTRNWKGYMDEIAIYTQMLTEAEITDLAANTAYSTPSYAGKTLIRKYASADPGVAVGAEVPTVSESQISIANISPLTATYSALGTFAETLGGGNVGNRYYQISKDGTNWKYWNGTIWTVASAGNYNDASTVNSFLPQFTSDIGRGDIYVKAFLSGNNQPVEIDNLAIGYAPLTVSLSATIQTLAESIGSGTITVQSSATWATDIVVPYTVSGSATGGSVDHNLANGNITITAGNTSANATINITNDTLDEVNETVIITLGAPDHGIASGNTEQTITITDDDGAPSLNVSASATDESNALSIAVSLSTTSGQNVFFDYASSNGTAVAGVDYTAVSGTGTILAGQTSTNISVPVTNDTIDEGNETLTLTISNPVSATLGTASNTGTINDDDAAPSIQFNSLTSNGAESTSPTLTVSLSATSGKTVGIDYALSGTATASGTDYTLANGTATISAGSVSTTISPTIVNDVLDEDNETVILTLSNPGNSTLGSNTTHTYTITDDDATPTVTFTSAAQTVGEDVGTATITAQLSALSGRNVSVPFSLSGTATGSGTDYSITSSPVTINAGSTTTTITTTVINDSLDENNESVIVTMGSPTNATQGATPVHTVTITDNDTTGVTIAESGGSVVITEGSVTDTYTVVLASEPTADVTVTPTPNAQVTVTPTSLTFTSANWSTPQTITVTPVNDLVAEGSHTGTITHTATSSDTGYSSTSIASVTPQITDNDSAAISRAETSGSTAATEGGATDSYTFVLTSEPTNNVTITLSATQVTPSAATLTFTAANWNVAQTITVTATNDSKVESNHNGTITHTVASSDLTYNGMSLSSLTVAVTDNDSAGVSVTQSGGSTVVTEVGNADDYTIVLTSEPSGNVTIGIANDSQLSVTPSSLTFTPANWSTAQTVSITAVNDNRKDSVPNSTLTHTITATADANYPTTLTVNSVVVTITDNDSVGVTITESSNTTSVTEGSGSDTYTIVLVSEPTATATITPTAGTGLTVTPSSVSFTGANWSTPQTITVSATDDEIAAADRSVSITHAISTADTDYAALTVSSVSVSVTDAGADSDTDTDTGTGTDTASGTGGATNTAPMVTAGADQTVVPGSVVSLFALATDADSDAISYTWTQSLGKSVTINNASSANASVAFGSDAYGTYVFSVTVSDGEAGVADTVAVNVLKKEVSITDFNSEKKSGKVLASKNGKQIIATLTDSAMSQFSSLPRYTIDLGDSVAATISAIEGVTAGIGEVLHIAVPLANDGAGRLYAIDKEALAAKLICLECDLSGTAGVTVMDGEAADEFLGFMLKYGDLNGDGIEELIVAAPGSEFGTIYVLNQRTLEVEMKLMGSSSTPLQSSGLSVFDMNGDGIDDIIFIKNASSSAQLLSDLLASSFTVTSDESQYMGILGSESLPAIFDLSVDDPDFIGTSESSLTNMASGDVNDDGFTDLITASETCEVEIYFGSDAIGDETTDMASDVVFSCDMTTALSDLVVGDVNGDGIDDLVFGFPEEEDDLGSIYIIMGIETWEEDYGFAQAVSIAGDEGQDIADWLLLDDDNDDSIADIYTNLGDSDTYVISMAEMAEVSATDAGSGAAATGCSLSANQASSATSVSLLVMTALTAMLVLGRRTLFNNG